MRKKIGSFFCITVHNGMNIPIRRIAEALNATQHSSTRVQGCSPNKEVGGRLKQYLDKEFFLTI